MSAVSQKRANNATAEFEAARATALLALAALAFLGALIAQADARDAAAEIDVAEASMLPDRETRDALMEELEAVGIRSTFHYIPLHSSPMGRKLGCDEDLPVTDAVSGRLLRLPMFYELTEAQIEWIARESDRILRRRDQARIDLPGDAATLGDA